MARTSVTPTSLAANSATAQVTTTIDSTLVSNGVKIPSNRGGQRLLLVIVNSAVGAKVATVKAGTDSLNSTPGPAWMAGQGDLAVTVAAAAAAPSYIGPFDSARFEQADGSVYVDLASGFTGTLEVYQWPAGY